MRSIGVILLGLALPFTLTAGDAKTGVEEINVKGFSFMRKGGSVQKPIVIEKAEDLKGLEGAPELVAAINKAVSFDKRIVLVFAWAGSGGDRIKAGEIKDGNVSFLVTRGLTRDLRHHLRVFTLPKGTTWKVEEVRRGAD